jgi:excisionase family DNA binding protein
MSKSQFPTNPPNIIPLTSKDGFDAALYCGCSHKTLRREIAARRLTALRIGNRIKFRRSDLDAWLDSKTIGTVA